MRSNKKIKREEAMRK